MKLKIKNIAGTAEARQKDDGLGRSTGTTIYSREELMSMDLAHPEMERRWRAQRVWEFLDEGKSSFYARMKEGEPNYDPLFPKPVPMSSSGKGPKRWKLGAVIAWLRVCEAAADNS